MFLSFSLVGYTAREAPGNGRLIKLRRFWMSQTFGKGEALRKEQGVFAYFCRRMDKSKASGGTRPAGFVFKNRE